MKKLLYFALVEKRTNDAYYQKVISQVNEFNKHFDTELICLTKRKKKINLLIKIKSYLIFYINIIKFLKHESPNVIYFRHPAHNLILIFLLAYYKIFFKKSLIIEEIPTFPLENLNLRIQKNLLAYSYTLLQFFLRFLSSLFTNKYTVIGGKGYFFFKDTLEISNGLVSNKSFFRNKKISKLKLLVIANLSERHGIDKLIYSMKNFKKKACFTIIGDGKEKKKLIKIVKENNLSKKIIFKNYLNLSQISEIINNYDVGIGNLGFYRIGVKNTSALKELLYLKYGLPVVYSGYNKIYKKFNNKIFFKVKNNNKNIDLYKIYKFSQKFWLNKKKKFLYKELYKDLSWTNSMKDLVSYIKNAHQTTH